MQADATSTAAVWTLDTLTEAANALNAVSAALDQKTLQSLNAAVVVDKGTPAQVAEQFVAQILT